MPNDEPTIAFVDWRRYRHHHNRHVPWIKLYAKLCEDRDWRALDGAIAKLLVDLWAIGASTEDGAYRGTLDELAWQLHRKDRATLTKELQVLAAVKDTDTQHPKWIILSRQALDGVYTQSRQTKPTDSAGFAHEFDTGFWPNYPKRAGGNPRKAALAAYCARRRQGVSATELFDGVRRYCRFCEETGKLGTEWVKQAVSWLGPKCEGWTQDWACPAPELSKDDEDELARRAARI